jgi:hypothetical protein
MLRGAADPRLRRLPPPVGRACGPAVHPRRVPGADDAAPPAHDRRRAHAPRRPRAPAHGYAPSCPARRCTCSRSASVHWRQQHFRPAKPLPSDARAPATGRRGAGWMRTASEVVLAAACLGIPLMFERRGARDFELGYGAGFQAGGAQAGAGFMLGACTCLVVRFISLCSDIRILTRPVFSLSRAGCAHARRIRHARRAPRRRLARARRGRRRDRVQRGEHRERAARARARAARARAPRARGCGRGPAAVRASARAARRARARLTVSSAAASRSPRRSSSSAGRSSRSSRARRPTRRASPAARSGPASARSCSGPASARPAASSASRSPPGCMRKRAGGAGRDECMYDDGDDKHAWAQCCIRLDLVHR